MGKIEIVLLRPDGTVIGDRPGTNVIRFTATEPINRIGSFEFDLPVGDTIIDILTPQTRIEAWWYEEQTDGKFCRKLAGDGIVKNRTLTVSAEGEPTTTISGMGLGQELADDIVMMSLAGADGMGVIDAPRQVLSRFPGWSLDATGLAATETRFYGAFAGETGMEALIAIAEKLGENFIILPGRKVKWLGSVVAVSGLRATTGISPERLGENPDAVAIESFQLETVGDTIVTRVAPYGAGDGEARLTLSASDWTPPAGWTINRTGNELVNAGLEGRIGKIKRVLSFNDIAPVANTDADLRAAANQLAIATHATMKRHAGEQRSYRLSVAGLRLGRIRSGETLFVDMQQFVDGRKTISIHEDLVILSITKTFEEDGAFIPTLEVSNAADWILTDNQVLASALREQIAAQAHPQLSANCWWMSFQPRMDKSNRGEISFWLTKEIVTVNEISLYFRILPLESSVKSVAGQSSTSGASSTSTSATDGGGAVTSGASSKTTSDNAPGQNYDTSTAEVDPYTQTTEAVEYGYMETEPGANAAGHKHRTHVVPHYHKYGLIRHDHRVYVAGHSHGMDHTHRVDVPSHSHRMEHTHQITPKVTMEYGLFRNSGSNTHSIEELAINVNGGVDLRPSAVDVGGGWFRLDVTASCANSIFRPTRENNRVVFSTMVEGKTCMIDAKLKVRSVIQAIAYF